MIRCAVMVGSDCQLLQLQPAMNKKEDYDYNLKLLLIGNSNVGKSCLLLRFSEDKFQSKLLNTIGVDFKTKVVNVNGQRAKLVLWDTAGQQRFRTITNSYYRNANGIIIVYDITDRQSFDNVAHWYDEMSKSIDQKVSCVIVGNKIDLQARRVVSYQQGHALANKYQLPFCEASAKNSHNVKQMFEGLTMQIIGSGSGNKPARKRPPLPIKQQTNEDEYCKCCQN